MQACLESSNEHSFISISISLGQVEGLSNNQQSVLLHGSGKRWVWL
jgi:hypothetical protein